MDGSTFISHVCLDATKQRLDLPSLSHLLVKVFVVAIAPIVVVVVVVIVLRANKEIGVTQSARQTKSYAEIRRLHVLR